MGDGRGWPWVKTRLAAREARQSGEHRTEATEGGMRDGRGWPLVKTRLAAREARQSGEHRTEVTEVTEPRRGNRRWRRIRSLSKKRPTTSTTAAAGEQFRSAS
jgi:hypothetical protein